MTSECTVFAVFTLVFFANPRVFVFFAILRVFVFQTVAHSGESWPIIPVQSHVQPDEWALLQQIKLHARRVGDNAFGISVPVMAINQPTLTVSESLAGGASSGAIFGSSTPRSNRSTAAPRSSTGGG